MARTLKTSLPLLALGGLVSCSAPEEAQGPDVSKIVYAVRQHTLVDGSGNVTNIDVAGGMGQVMDYDRYEPGGRLEVLDLRTPGRDHDGQEGPSNRLGHSRYRRGRRRHSGVRCWLTIGMCERRSNTFSVSLTKKAGSLPSTSRPYFRMS